jgi:hypothetical protein
MLVVSQDNALRACPMVPGPGLGPELPVAGPNHPHCDVALTRDCLIPSSPCNSQKMSLKKGKKL